MMNHKSLIPDSKLPNSITRNWINVANRVFEYGICNFEYLA
jgi:hypothetical protein